MSVSGVRRTMVLTAIVLALVVLIGATYQGVTTAIERRRFPFPGRLVDVGGHQLHLYCTGAGAPTVVLEAPAAGISAAWAWVQGSISQFTRVCSYERAGLGWSVYKSTQMMQFVEAWVAVGASVIVSLAIYGLVTWVGRRLVWW